jgi:hypothetical protein
MRREEEGKKGWQNTDPRHKDDRSEILRIKENLDKQELDMDDDDLRKDKNSRKAWGQGSDGRAATDGSAA